MTDAHFLLDGASYISTPDVNLLDADTAHMHQSIGDWVGFAGGDGAAQSQVLPPIIGAFHGVYNSTAGGTAALKTSGIAVFPAVPGQVYTGSAFVAGSNPGVGTMEVRIVFYDAGLIPILTGVGEEIVTPAGFEVAFDTETAPANTVWVTAQMLARDTVTSDKIYWDAYCIREGTDPTFKPSLNIVGTLFEEKDDPLQTIGYTPGSPLTIGEAWAGEVFHYRRFDGVDNTAPKVLELTTVGAPPGIIDPDTFWIGPDGRVYTTSGTITNVPPTGGGGANYPDVHIHRSNRLVKRLISGDVQIHRYT